MNALMHHDLFNWTQSSHQPQTVKPSGKIGRLTAAQYALTKIQLQYYILPKFAKDVKASLTENATPL